ncbi:RagB/SusD family nutrient uptake outer membrane protein [Roseimarinus sediminis]|uniref:RagB/SusD family nutrient uptake outer membrane protein n=1 Tax=Roseimarinus sediminis TaxID=1610899 RepID=UPI003D2189F8
MKIKNIPAMLIVLLLFACDGFLDIEPKQSIDSETALSSSENLRLALNQAYVNIRNGYGQQLLHAGALLPDDGEIFFQGTYLEPREYLNKELVASSLWPREAWQDLYKGIYICNQVLGHIEVAEPDAKNQLMGEALFLRGLCYFDLTRYFAPAYEPGGANEADAVPLLLENDTTMYPPRASVEAVINQAQADLEQAASLLAPDEHFFAGSYAAKAILSRLYLMKEEWEKAATAASEVIESGQFSLMETPLAAFNHPSNLQEDVFAFQQNNDDNLGSEQGTGNEGMSTFYASTNVTGRSDFAMNDKVFDLYEEGDLRAAIQTDLGEDSDESDIESMYYRGFGSNSNDGIFCAKWLNFENNVTFIRLAEMYLTRAEANLENGSETGDLPVNDIARIRSRAGLSTPETIDLELVRTERIRELIFEGWRLHHYRRWKWSVGELPYNAPRLVLPIPQRERDVNNKLSQNNGY